ncbi:MAG: ATP-binding protein, partial [Syntrophomonadaceae bacterium]|nr:ATP-binding protein [Syntrophomonadaceae bacterium]
MNSLELEKLLDELRALPHETEWVEFKQDRNEPQQIGEYISALSNSACLHGKEAGYLVFGIEDGTHAVKGTSFEPDKEKIGNQEIENWLATQLSPRIDFEIISFTYQASPIV